ncbi:MAG: hypothetical protein V9E98_01380 [Candidatus Nanopelagicales bacterium]
MVAVVIWEFNANIETEAGECDHEQQVGALAHMTHAGADPAMCPAGLGGSGRDARQSDEHHDEGRGVDEEHPPGPERGDHHPRDRRAEESGGVEGGTVE